MLKRLLLVVALLAASISPASALTIFGGSQPGHVTTSDATTTLLASTCANCWADGGSSTLNSVIWSCSVTGCGGGGYPSDAPAASSLGSPPNIMAQWTGGAYDSDDNELIVWGGGHTSSYYGNELYGFQFATLTWARLSVPSTLVGWSGGALLADGNPAAPHGYDGQLYVPGTGLFQLGSCGVLTGGCGLNSFRQSISGLSPFSYNHWTSGVLANVPNVVSNQVSGYDPTTQRVYVWGGFGSIPLNYLAPPYTGAWVSTGGSAITNGGNMTAAIQPGVQMVVVGGATGFIAINLTTGNAIATSHTGDTTLDTCSAAGFEWDSSASKFVGWCGTTTVYIMDPSTHNVVAHTISGRNTVTPLCTGFQCSAGIQANGTYGRFRYLPAYNAFSVANSTTDHVYLYRPDF